MPKLKMFLASSCSCLCLIHWSQVSSWEWRCSWSSADRRCSSHILHYRFDRTFVYHILTETNKPHQIIVSQTQICKYWNEDKNSNKYIWILLISSANIITTGLPHSCVIRWWDSGTSDISRWCKFYPINLAYISTTLWCLKSDNDLIIHV